MFQTVLAIIKLSLILYAACMLFLYVLQDRFIFFPQPTQTTFEDTLQHYALSITRNNTTLHGWFIKKTINENKPLIIYYGGNAEELSNLAAQANSYSSAGGTLFMNYRGYGKSTGKPSQKTLCEDAVFILDHIAKKENISLANIIVVGRSLGSGIATYVVSKRNIRSTVLITAYDSILSVAQKQYPIFPIGILLKHPFNSLELAPSIKIPLLNIMAEHDTIIPNKHAKLLAAKWQGPSYSVTIKGSGHNDIDSFPEYWLAINSFIKKGTL